MYTSHTYIEIHPIHTLKCIRNLMYTSHTYTVSQLNTGQIGGSMGRDLNVEPAWMQGINGEGIVVAVVDDGMYAIWLPSF